MKVYFDIFNSDEIVSDSYKMEKKFNDVIGEVRSRFITKGGENIDIGKGNEFGGAEEDEAVDDQTEKVLDLVEGFHLNETSFDKAQFTVFFRDLMKRTKAHLEAKNKDRVAGFMEGAKLAAKWINENFDEFTFYYGEKNDTDAGVVLSYYQQGEDETPTFVYFLDALNARTF